MNDWRKWLIGIGIVGVLCVCALGVAFLVLEQGAQQVTKSFKTDATGVAQVSAKIADFDLPPGYVQSGGMSLFVYDFVMYAPPDSQAGMSIMLMQFSSGTGYNTQQMQQAMQQQSGRSSVNMQVVKTYQTSIRGQTSTVVVEDSLSSENGYALRELYTFFPGRGGTVMLMISGSRDAWDQSLAVAFIASIR